LPPVNFSSRSSVGRAESGVVPRSIDTRRKRRWCSATCSRRIAWWMIADLRLRAGKLRFTEPHAPDGTPLPAPEADGWDVSAQGRLTIDARHYRYGVRWGPYVQLLLDTTIPGLDDYDYSIALLRAYYSWRILDEHQLELRALGHVGRQLPFHEEITLGGVTDLRGYAVDRFRGDVRTLFGFLHECRVRASAILEDVRVIPQCHKILHVR